MLKIKDSISTNSISFLYGKLLFETFFVNEKGEVFLFDNHMNRMKKSYYTLFNNNMLESSNLNETVIKYIKINNVKNKILRISLFNESNEACISFKERDNVYTNEVNEKGFSLKFSGLVKSKNSNIIRHKSGNYLDNLIELERSRNENYDDCIFLNENENLTETCVANLFFIKNNKVFTPGIDTGILPGILREWTIKKIKEIGNDIREGLYNKSDILNSEEIFITNSTFGIMYINKIQNKSFEKGHITNHLINILNPML